MNRGMRLTVCAATALALSACRPLARDGGPGDRPNVVLIMTDDQGFGDLSCHGNPVLRTPNLDALHAESVRLTDFHVDPTCAPTRAALLTGRYSLATGVWHTISGRSFLRHDERTMGDVFTANGYVTGMFGKWHLGDNAPMRPWDRGFGEVISHGGGGVGQTPDLWGNDYFDDQYWHNGKPERFEGYCTDVFFGGAERFIEANRRKPFFCYLVPNAPHGPYNCPDEYSKPYRDQGVPPNRASFYGMVTNIDDNVGRLLKKLRDLGLERNTIVIFMTDNGTAGPWYPKEGKDFAAGLRGIKGSIYDGGHRVPCFVRWPAGGITGGRDVDRLAGHVDLLPTLIDLCEMNPADGQPFHGRNLVPLLRGVPGGLPDRTMIVNNQRIAVPEKWRNFVVMTDRWRLVNRTELYDMEADRGQTRNVAADHADVVGRLTAEYESWWSSMTAAGHDPVPIIVGTERENPTLLSAHDWHAKKVPWDQSVVKEDPPLNGDWVLKVATSGRYRITLRQRPEEARHPIDAVKARVRIGESERSADVAPGAVSIAFDLDLPEGPARLQSWITDAKGVTRGAYYASLRLLNAEKTE